MRFVRLQGGHGWGLIRGTGNSQPLVLPRPCEKETEQPAPCATPAVWERNTAMCTVKREQPAPCATPAVWERNTAMCTVKLTGLPCLYNDTFTDLQDSVSFPTAALRVLQHAHPNRPWRE